MLLGIENASRKQISETFRITTGDPVKQAEKFTSLGWREWVALPELGLVRIKAKVDSGARTSALHAFFVETIEQEGILRVRFMIHPFQHDTQTERECVADLVEERLVTDSGGHSEMRQVIRTPIMVGQRKWPIEITLTNRDTMKFRMLLGRNALKGNYLINPGNSFLAGKPSQI